MHIKKLFFLTILLLSQNHTHTKSTKHTKGTIMSQQGDSLDIASFKKTNYTVNGKKCEIAYKIIQAGSEKTKPLAGETATVHYTGWLLSNGNTVGKKFDSSVDRGTPFEFPVGMGYVIKGWDFMVADMTIGEKRIVILPPEVAYGARGAGAAIPANATLIFEIELLNAE
jgi:peptidylprolyl isomerase